MDRYRCFTWLNFIFQYDLRCAAEFNTTLLEENRANIAKYESLIAAMKQTPHQSFATQTSQLSGFPNSEYTIDATNIPKGSSEGSFKSDERPKSICRVSGLFGSADADGSVRKRVEVHTENYDDYTNVNIRLNK